MFPWLVPVWNQWLESVNSGHLSAATLLVAENGVGVENLIMPIAKGILCQNGNEGCGFCHSCRLFDSGSHPDFHHIQPEKAGKAITVEQIRSTNRFAVESSQLGGYRVITIDPADSMNESAANALLKTLEEPAKKCCFLLVSYQIKHIPATIVSRCRKTTLTNPKVDITAGWLAGQGYENIPSYIVKINNYAPLETLEFLQQKQEQTFIDTESQFVSFLADPTIRLFSLIELLKSNSVKALVWLWYGLSDALKIQQGIYLPDFTPKSQAIADKVSYALLHKQQKALTVVIHQLTTQPGLNDELLITNWLLDFIEDPCL